MPGPLLLFPPLNLDFLDQLADNVGGIWRQARHPVFNAAGLQVGSYDTLDALCQGQWFPLVGVTRPPASQLYVVDFWGRKVPLSTQCVASAKATAKGGSIVHPQPVQPTSAVKAVQASNTAATGSPAPVLDLDAISGPIPALPAVSQTDLVKYGTYALWAGGALLAGALIFGGDNRSRGRR